LATHNARAPAIRRPSVLCALRNLCFIFIAFLYFFFIVLQI
jgi:hypothetical protein